MVWFLTMLGMLSLINVTYSQAVDIATDSIQPNEDILLISDMDTNTCVTFNATTGQRGPWYTELRVEMNFGEDGYIEVQGDNLGCNTPGVMLYVSALHQPNSWTGVSETCAHIGYEFAGTEICKYRCACVTTCDWLQIVRRPLSGNSPSWSLCYIKSCPPDWTYKEAPDRCYVIPNDSKTSSEAIVGCISLHPQARLVEIRTSAENQAVAEIQGSTKIWIGGILVSGQWQWLSNGEAISEFHWDSEEPSGENCMAVYEGAAWHDAMCTIVWNFMCELTP